MNCRDMDEWLSGGRELPPEARAHLSECENCRALAGVMGDEVDYTLDPAVLARVRQHVAGAVPAVRPMAPVGAFAAVFLVIAGCFGALFGSIKGILGLPNLSGAQAAAIFGVVLAMLLLSAMALAGEMRPGAWTVRGGVLFALGLAGIETVFLTLFSDYAMGRFVHQGTACFTMGMTCSILTGLGSWLVLRRGYITAPVSTGATVGALSGLAGLAALELHCPVLLVPHLAVWHTAVFVVSAALGAVVGWVSARRAA